MDERHPSGTFGVYAQDQLTIRQWLLLNAGTRLDYDAAFGTNLSPRAGLVILPNSSTALKLLYGRAFRAPSSYELHYFPTMRDEGLTLEPETIATSEVVWEQNIGAHVRAEFSAFHYDTNHLVEQRALNSFDPEIGYGLYYGNTGRTTANGVDADLEARWGGGFTGSLGYGYVRAKDWNTNEPLSNSPRHLTTIRVAAPLGRLASTVAFEAHGVSERRVLDGHLLPGFIVSSVIATRSINTRLDVQLGVYDVLGTRYADPGAEEHLQRSITQDGRSARVRVVARF